LRIAAFLLNWENGYSSGCPFLHLQCVCVCVCVCVFKCACVCVCVCVCARAQTHAGTPCVRRALRQTCRHCRLLLSAPGIRICIALRALGCTRRHVLRAPVFEDQPVIARRVAELPPFPLHIAGCGRRVQAQQRLRSRLRRAWAQVCACERACVCSQLCEASYAVVNAVRAGDGVTHRSRDHVKLLTGHGACAIEEEHSTHIAHTGTAHAAGAGRRVSGCAQRDTADANPPDTVAPHCACMRSPRPAFAVGLSRHPWGPLPTEST